MRSLRHALVTLGLLGSFWLPATAYAQSTESGYQSILSQGLIFANICSSSEPGTCACRDSGQCQLSDMLQIFINLSIGILAISGSIALLMFFYGGFTWVTSMGNAKKIEQGKDIIVRAVIGLAIIFGAYAFVNFIIAAISGQAPGGTIEDTINSATSSSGSVEAQNVLNTQ